MRIKAHIPPLMAYLTQDQVSHEVLGSSIQECLDCLVETFPGLREWLFGADGKLNSGIDVYLNHQSLYPDGLESNVKDGDEISVVDIIIGG